MHQIKRAVHLDFHTLPGIYDFGRAFDAASFAETLVNANVDYVNITAKCNIGFAYYDTKIGVRYPYMKGDMFGDMLRECKRRGIGVTAYFNVGLDHVQALKHRDWCRVNEEGQVIYGDKTANFFRMMCLNSGYKDYILSLIQEVVNRYDVDGVFMDCLDMFNCYGNECTNEIIEQGGDFSDEATVSAHTQKVFVDFCRAAKKITGDDKYFYINGNSSFPAMDCLTHSEIECLTSTTTWGYETFGAQVAYCRNLKDKVVFMTGRFQNNWGDFGGFKGKPALENDIWEAFGNGVYSISIGDHLHPAENLNPYIYKTISEIYNETAKLDDWIIDAKYLAEVGVLLAPPYSLLRKNHKGLARMLAELKIAFDIIRPEMPFDKYKLLILPDDVIITPQTKQKLEKYLADGGKVISTGISGLNEEKTDFAMEEWKKGFDFCGIDQSNSSYLRFTKEFCNNPPDMNFSMYEHGMVFNANENAVTLADYVKPYFNRKWDGQHGYFYTPPEKKTGNAAAAQCGNIIQICFNIFESYYNNAMLEHKKLIEYCIKEFYKEPLIKECKLPSTARATLTQKPNVLNLHVKATFPETRGEKQIIEEHQILPAGYTLKVRGEYPITYSAPERTPVKSVTENGYTVITLPEIKGYKLIGLEK